MPAPLQPLVTLRGLTKSYGHTQALRGVDLEIPEGSLYGLLGPNGSGKTSALECLLGLRKPDAGEIRIAGVDALAQPARAHALIGALIQATRLQANITPREALELWAAFHGQRIDAQKLLEQFGLETKARARFDTLSAGQKQRLMLGLAVLHAPKLLILDEPCAGLDPAARKDLHDTLRGLREKGCTILLSTHDLADTAVRCDHIAILHEGRILAHGEPAELLARHGIAHRIDLRTEKPEQSKTLAALAGSGSVWVNGDGWSIGTHHPQMCIRNLVTHLSATGNSLLDLHVSPPSLGELFLSLTGRDWDDENKRREPR